MFKKIYGKVWNEEAPLTIRVKGDKAKSKFIVFKKVLFLNPNVAGGNMSLALFRLLFLHEKGGLEV